MTCYDDPNSGFRCGDCPQGYRGDGIQCTIILDTCASNPCYPNVACVNYDRPPGYRCGACPHGFTGNGIHCKDINECEHSNPCHSQSACINRSPGFRCSACPTGFEGPSIYGVGLDQANSLKQVSEDRMKYDVKVQCQWMFSSVRPALTLTSVRMGTTEDV